MNVKLLQYNVSDFPTELPVFDILDTVLLPRAHLPLNAKNQKFKSLVEDVIKKDRLVGVIQKEFSQEEKTKIFQYGCLGKITTLTETEDDHYRIIISGLARFKVVKELRSKNGYRRFKVSYDHFAFDILPENQQILERDSLLSSLKYYLTIYNISVNWDEILSATDERLITSLTMICPFKPLERQALLESHTLRERGRMITALMEIAHLRQSNSSWITH